jgi:hypothetical protein
LGAIYIIWDVRATAEEVGWMGVWWVLMVAAVAIASVVGLVLLTRWKELTPQQRKQLVWLFLIA